MQLAPHSSVPFESELIEQLKKQLHQAEDQLQSTASQLQNTENKLQYAELKIRVLEERLRLVRIAKYGASSEKLSDQQLELLELEPGVEAWSWGLEPSADR